MRFASAERNRAALERNGRPKKSYLLSLDTVVWRVNELNRSICVIFAGKTLSFRSTRRRQHGRGPRANQPIGYTFPLRAHLPGASRMPTASRQPTLAGFDEPTDPDAALLSSE